MVTSTWSMLALYAVICVGLVGFFVTLGWIMQLWPKRQTDEAKARCSMWWGPPGIGKTGNISVDHGIVWPRHGNIGDILRVDRVYPSAYSQGHDVHFNDPIEAYNYVVEAVKQKNLMVDRLENTAHRGAQNNYEWLWVDTQIDREYWLNRLNEFREDV